MILLRPRIRMEAKRMIIPRDISEKLIKNLRYHIKKEHRSRVEETLDIEDV